MLSIKRNLACLFSATLHSTCTCTVKCLIHKVIMHARTQYIPQSGPLSWVQHFLLVWQMRCVHRRLLWHTLSHWKWSRNAAPRAPFVLSLDVDQSWKKCDTFIPPKNHTSWNKRGTRWTFPWHESDGPVALNQLLTEQRGDRESKGISAKFLIWFVRTLWCFCSCNWIRDFFLIIQNQIVFLLRSFFMAHLNIFV